MIEAFKKAATWLRTHFWAPLVLVAIGVGGFLFRSIIRRAERRKDQREDTEAARLDAKRAHILAEATMAEREAIHLGRQVEENRQRAEAKEEEIRNMTAEQVAEEYRRVFAERNKPRR